MKLELKNIHKSFGDKEILHGINMTVQSGRALGFLGRNGAGKSTTIRCIMEVFRQDEGDILLDGKPFHAKSQRVGYLPEERGMYSKAKVLDQLIYFGMLRGGTKEGSSQSATKWLEYFELGEWAKRPLEQLSKGNQQKVQIIQAFVNDPDLLILDEPFSGLDPVNAQIFKDAIGGFVKEGKLVIFSSHQMAYVEELCDDIALIHEGNILLEGDLDAILKAKSKNRWVLEGRDNHALKALIERDFPAFQLESYEDGFILDAGGKLDQAALFSAIASQGLLLEKFERWMPTLNDLFIETVGGEKQ